MNRFSLSYFWNLIHEDLLEVDRGFLRTTIDLTLRPGQMIRSYLDGNTRKYFSPIKYLLALAAIVYFLLALEEAFHPSPNNEAYRFKGWKDVILSEEHAPFSTGVFLDMVDAFPMVTKDYLGAYFLLMLPFAALAGQFLFRKMNFTELLISWMYLWGHILYLLLAITFVLAWVGPALSGSTSFLIVSVSLMTALMFYFFVKTFRELSEGNWFTTLLKVLGSMYGGFLAFIGATWLVLGSVKWLYMP